MARHHMIDSAGLLGANLVAEELLTGVSAKETQRAHEVASKDRHKNGQKATVQQAGQAKNPRPSR